MKGTQRNEKNETLLEKNKRKKQRKKRAQEKKLVDYPDLNTVTPTCL